MELLKTTSILISNQYDSVFECSILDDFKMIVFLEDPYHVVMCGQSNHNQTN
jgi:hypothetical protein